MASTKPQVISIKHPAKTKSDHTNFMSLRAQELDCFYGTNLFIKNIFLKIII